MQSALTRVETSERTASPMPHPRTSCGMFVHVEDTTEASLPTLSFTGLVTPITITAQLRVDRRKGQDENARRGEMMATQSVPFEFARTRLLDERRRSSRGTVDAGNHKAEADM